MTTPDRRTKQLKQIQISDALSKELDGFPGILKRWGNTVLTCVLLAAAVAMLVRWRLASVEQARLAVLTSLSNARNFVSELRPENLANASISPDYLASHRADIASRARGEIADVLNNTDDPKLKAQALITRGDLYWQLANFPELPGATTQPALQYPDSRADLLKKAADEYSTVLKTDAFLSDIDSRTSAHFGLAAVAENQSDWDTAKHELESIANDTTTLPVLAQTAKDQLAKLPQIQTPMYIAPATQPVVDIATAQPLSEVVTAHATTTPTTTPTTQPK